MPREAVAHAHRSGERGSGAARGEHPDRRQRHTFWHDANGRERMVGGKLAARQREHLLDLIRKQFTVEWPERA